MADIPVTERLKALRVRAGVSMAQAAAACGYKTASGYQHYEDPSKFTKRYLPLDVIEKLVTVFVGRAAEGETPITDGDVWALGGRGEFTPIPLPHVNSPATRGNVLIPVYAAAMGGAGHLIVTFDPVDELKPPEELVNVKKPYGILIVGESMVPAYRPGDIAWVNPHKLPERDSDVVLYHVPPNGEAEAIIKTLIGFSPREWKLRQYHPPLDFTESRADWTVCHRIVGKKNVR